VDATYYVQVINNALEAISERIVVKAIPECSRNVARLTFEQLP
jgi:hypothetical protein